MRRTRFAGAVEITSELRARASIREALWFDIRSPDSNDDHSLSAWRVAPLDHSALMLGVTHLIAALALLALHPEQALHRSLANPLIPLSALLALDLVAIIGLRWRDRWGLAPHTAIRALATYLAAVGTLWILIGLAIIAEDHAGHASLPILIIGGGI